MSETTHHPETLDRTRDELIKDLNDLVVRATPWGGDTRVSDAAASVMSRSLSNGSDSLTISRPVIDDDRIYTEPGRCAAKVIDYDGSSFSSWEVHDEAYVGPKSRDVYITPPKEEWPTEIRNKVRALKMMSGMAKVVNHLTNFTSISDAEQRRAQRLDTSTLELLMAHEIARPATDDEIAQLNGRVAECLELAS